MPSTESTVALGIADYTVMGLYMAGLIALGLYYRKFAQQGLENYFLAGRKFKGWITGTSYAVTCMNADVPVVYCGMAVITGVWICWFYIARFGLALLIGAVLFAVFWRRLKIFTSPEFYELRFSGPAAITMRSWVSLRSAFIAVVAWTGGGLLGLSKVSGAVLGWDQELTFLVVIPVILVYVILSGYVGVVVSDVFQATILIVSSLVLMGLVWHDFGGPGGLYAALVDQFGAEVVSWHPPASHELFGLMGVLAWILGTAVGYGGDIAPMAGAMEGQRVLSCRNSREASKMYVWTCVMLFFMLAVLTLPSLGAMVKWPGLYTREIEDQEIAYGLLLGYYMPTGLLGLALIGLFASIMSTVDSNMNLGAQVFINDVYRRLINRKASVQHYMHVGKAVMLVIMGLAIVVALTAEKLIDISIFMLGLSSAELTANWGQWWWWRFNGAARLAASFGGPMIFLALRYAVYPALVVPFFATPQRMPSWLGEDADRYADQLSERLTPDVLDGLTPQMLAQPTAEMLESLTPGVLGKLTPELLGRTAAETIGQLRAEMIVAKVTSTYWYIPVLSSIALTCLLWIAVALLSPPDPEDKLVEFYKQARPMGWWGPIAAKAGVEPLGYATIFRGLGIAAAGAVMAAAGTIAFSCLYVAQWRLAAAAATLAVAAGVLFKITYARYMRRLRVER